MKDEDEVHEQIKTRATAHVAEAMQHQEMSKRFTAYEKFRSWIESEIETVNDEWDQKDITIDHIQYLKGHKHGLQLVKDHIDQYFRVHIKEE